ncbi:hypothetical protein EVAR_54170_1 [Eumeta japonica]|uniref:Uncharacterized protein n=1 Tax=Eumeta variegata TaxID=151549 RepID=A0A4C1Y112_EUMVA|nr:hypothetical protein EVAR_54170_1 [Eumeta japonica]
MISLAVSPLRPDRAGERFYRLGSWTTESVTFCANNFICTENTGKSRVKNRISERGRIEEMELGDGEMSGPPQFSITGRTTSRKLLLYVCILVLLRFTVYKHERRGEIVHLQRAARTNEVLPFPRQRAGRGAALAAAGRADRRRAAGGRLSHKHAPVSVRNLADLSISPAIPRYPLPRFVPGFVSDAGRPYVTLLPLPLFMDTRIELPMATFFSPFQLLIEFRMKLSSAVEGLMSERRACVTERARSSKTCGRFRKLHCYGVTDRPLDLLTSYLIKKVQGRRHMRASGSVVRMVISEGSSLSPYPFLVHINDLQSLVKDVHDIIEIFINMVGMGYNGSMTSKFETSRA